MDHSPRKPFLEKLTPNQNAKFLQEAIATHPDHFPNKEAARDFFFQIIFPPSMRWTFISTGKNASTSVLNWLFEQEFGVPLTVKAEHPIDINPASEIHTLPIYGIFSRALLQGYNMEHFKPPERSIERLCVVRNPFERAISAFRYLCKSQKLESRWFAPDRFKLNAFFRFDWEKDMDTPKGFLLFLNYIQWQIELEGADAVNDHWRPQYTFIKPDLFEPTVIGRMEDMDRFYSEASERIGFPSPLSPKQKNAQTTSAQKADLFKLYDSPEARGLCSQIYQQDYEHFGY